MIILIFPHSYLSGVLSVLLSLKALLLVFGLKNTSLSILLFLFGNKPTLVWPTSGFQILLFLSLYVHHNLSHLVVPLPTSLCFSILIKTINLVMVVHGLYLQHPLLPHFAASNQFSIFLYIILQPSILLCYLVFLQTSNFQFL